MEIRTVRLESDLPVHIRMLGVHAVRIGPCCWGFCQHLSGSSLGSLENSGILVWALMNTSSCSSSENSQGASLPTETTQRIIHTLTDSPFRKDTLAA